MFTWALPFLVVVVVVVVVGNNLLAMITVTVGMNTLIKWERGQNWTQYVVFQKTFKSWESSVLCYAAMGQSVEDFNAEEDGCHFEAKC